MKPCTNLCHEWWYELGWCNPSKEHGGTQIVMLITWNDEDGHMWWWSSAKLGKEEREKIKPYGDESP
jgi:hypothetical protein